MTNNTNIPHLPPPTPTGGMLVTMKPGQSTSDAVKKLKKLTGMTVKSMSSSADDDTVAGLASQSGDVVYFENLGIAAVSPDDTASISTLTTSLSADDSVDSVRREFYLFATESVEQRYAAWVQDGLSLLAAGLPGLLSSTALFADQTANQGVAQNATWGIGAIDADKTPYDGEGIKVAVLDTGFVLNHPDFNGRNIVSRSFVPGESAEDQQGHGTHCIGTALGPKTQSTIPHYGVAGGAQIHVGKVLSNQGSGRESWILAGINWAIGQGCEIISMSLGRSVQPGEPPAQTYEAAGRAALNAGSIIIAAAGNDSDRRFNFVAPVNAPANSPSIMAVGAVDIGMSTANFSCGAINGNGGEVDICGPGVDVFSSYLMPLRHRRLDGTSMATPHVAGVAALLAQSNPALRGRSLWNALVNTAKDINLPASDGGAGLVQSPTSGAQSSPTA